MKEIENYSMSPLLLTRPYTAHSTAVYILRVLLFAFLPLSSSVIRDYQSINTSIMRYIRVYHFALATIAATPAIVYAAPSGFEDGAPFILKSNPQQDNAVEFKNKYGK